MIQIKLKWTSKRYNATQKVNALSEFVPYMCLFKNKMLKNSFFNSQFIYCPLIWVFHSRAANNKIYRSHERWMRLIYEDKTSSFEELSEHDKSVSIHTRNLQMLATEMFKVYRCDISYNLWSNSKVILNLQCQM